MTPGVLQKTFTSNLKQENIMGYSIVSYLQYQGKEEDIKDVLEEDIESEGEALELAAEYQMAFGKQFQIFIVDEGKELTPQQFANSLTITTEDRYGVNL